MVEPTKATLGASFPAFAGTRKKPSSTLHATCIVPAFAVQLRSVIIWLDIYPTICGTGPTAYKASAHHGHGSRFLLKPPVHEQGVLINETTDKETRDGKRFNKARASTGQLVKACRARRRCARLRAVRRTELGLLGSQRRCRSFRRRRCSHR
eukprot:3618137-Pleurochrysis_carterae.AAC.1